GGCHPRYHSLITTIRNLMHARRLRGQQGEAVCQMRESQVCMFSLKLVKLKFLVEQYEEADYGGIEGDSITNTQIKKFWTQKNIIEEGHLFAAVKAAARVRACNLSFCPFGFEGF
ncbi:hypothetical protein HID58_056087, partial [Brassica napus]